MARPYSVDIATSTTASSTTLPEGFHLMSVSNLDGTNNIIISFDEAIDTGSAGQTTLTPTNDTLNFNNINQIFQTEVIYWDASAGTPTLRIQGFIG